MEHSEKRFVLSALISIIIVFTCIWVVLNIVQDKNIENKEGTLDVYTEGEGIKTVYYIKTTDIEPYLSANILSSLEGVEKDGIITVIENSEILNIKIKNIQDESYITDETFNTISDYKVFNLTDTTKGIIKGSKYIDPDSNGVLGVAVLILILYILLYSIVIRAIVVKTNKSNEGVKG